MKHIKFISGFLFVVLFIYGCVETVTDPQNSYSIKITKPSNGDTVKVGRNRIDFTSTLKDVYSYEVKITTPVDKNELFVVEGEDSVALYLTVDSSLIDKKINYGINAYAKSGALLGQSEIKTEIRVRPNTDPPAAPSELESIPRDGSSVILRWKDNADNEAAYQLWRKDGEGGVYRIIKTLPANTTVWEDIDLSEFTVYYYKVSAKNGFGTSGFSNEASSLGTSGGAAPTNLSAQALGATIVMLTWTNNAEDAVLVKIQRKDGGDDTWKNVDEIPADEKEYVDEKGLIANTTYTYRIAAQTPTTISSWSNEATVTTKNTNIIQPSGLKASFQAEGRRVQVTWNDNTVMETGTYIERRKGLYGDFTEIGSVGTDKTVFFDENLEMEAVYYYRARHITTEGFYTKYSDIDSAYVPKLPPDAPSNLIVVNFGEGTYGLQWDDNSNDEDGFELQRKAQNGNYTSYKYFAPNVHAWNDNVQDTNKIYFYRIRAYRGTDSSSFSNEASSVGGSGNLLPPTGLTGALDTANMKISLSWIDNADNELGYEVERKMSSTSYSRVKILGPNAQSFTDTGPGLYRGTTYLYRVRAYDSEGFSAYSGEFEVTIPW